MNTLDATQNSDIENFYGSLLDEELYTNVLILDEILYLSQSRYHVPYKTSIEFLKTNVLPFSTVIPIEESDFSLIDQYLSRYKIKPSDAVHLATMEKQGITNIASEDKEFDGIKGIRRIWFSKSKDPSKRAGSKLRESESD